MVGTVGHRHCGRSVVPRAELGTVTATGTFGSLPWQQQGGSLLLPEPSYTSRSKTGCASDGSRYASSGHIAIVYHTITEGLPLRPGTSSRMAVNPLTTRQSLGT